MKLALYYLTKLLEMNSSVSQKARSFLSMFPTATALHMEHRMSPRLVSLLIPVLCLLGRRHGASGQMFHQINIRLLFLALTMQFHLKFLSSKTYLQKSAISPMLKSIMDNQLLSVSFCYGCCHVIESLKTKLMSPNKVSVVLESSYIVWVFFQCFFEFVTQTKKITDVQLDGVNLKEDDLEAKDFAKACPLCLKDQKVAASCIPCGHSFCWNCIHSALKVKSQCPICRFPASSSRVVQLKTSI